SSIVSSMLVRHELLAAAVVASTDAVVITDASGRIADLNPTAEAFFGQQAEEARGRALDTLVRFQGERPAPAGPAPAPVAVLPPRGGRRVLEGTLQRVHDSSGDCL